MTTFIANHLSIRTRTGEHASELIQQFEKIIDMDVSVEPSEENQVRCIVWALFDTFDKPPVDAYRQLQNLAAGQDSVVLEAYWTDRRDNPDVDRWYQWLFNGERYSDGSGSPKVISDYRKDEQPITKAKELSHSQLNIIKGECLMKYAERKPRLFYQIDCWGPNMTGDCMVDFESTGKGMTGVATWELMHSSPIRILIADDYTDHELLADMITQAAGWIRNDPELLKEHHAKTWDKYPSDGIPF